MSRKYFRYLVHSSKVQLIFFLILTMAFMAVPFVTGQSSYPRQPNFFDAVSLGTVITGLITLEEPIIQLSFAHRKRSADMIYALPITKKEQIVTVVIYTWLRAMIYFTAGLIVAFVLAFGEISIIDFLKTLGCVGFGLAVFTLLHSWLYLLANNIFDGIVMIVSYALLPLMIYLMILTVGETMIAGFSWNQVAGSKILDIISPYAIVSQMIQRISWQCAIGNHLFLGLTFFAIISAIGLYYEGVKRKAERAEQVSDRFLSYPFLINVYALVCLIMLGAYVVKDGIQSNLIWYLLLFLAYVVSSFVYRRKIQIDAKSIMLFIGAAVFAVIVFRGMWANQGFGFSEKYNLTRGDTITYEYDLYDYADRVNRAPEAVHFALSIPTDRLDQYQDAVDIMEKKRKQAIAEFYDNSDPDYDYNCTLTVGNSQDNERQVSYWYPDYIKLTEDELRVISKYADIDVLYQGENMTYARYQKVKGN